MDGDGKFTAAELGKAFEICGETLPGYALRDMISQYDIDRNGSLDLSEFIKVLFLLFLSLYLVLIATFIDYRFNNFCSNIIMN